MQTFVDGEMRAQDIVKFPKSLWAKVGGKTATNIVKDADKGKGYKKDFKAYTSEYAKLKAAGKAGPKGVGKSRQVSPPNLRLTGVMLGSISAQKPKETGVDIVYRDGIKVEHNAKMGRDIYGISDKNTDKITDELSDFIGKQIGKYAKDSITVTIG